MTNAGGRGRGRGRHGPEALDVKLTVMLSKSDRDLLSKMAEADAVSDSELLRRIIRQESRFRSESTVQFQKNKRQAASTGTRKIV